MKCRIVSSGIFVALFHFAVVLWWDLVSCGPCGSGFSISAAGVFLWRRGIWRKFRVFWRCCVARFFFPFLKKKEVGGFLVAPLYW